MKTPSTTFISYEVTQTMIRLGQVLKEARLARGDTQKQVAERLGVSTATYQRLESGSPEIRAGTLMQALVNYQMKDRVMALAAEEPLTTALLRRDIRRRGKASNQ